MDRIQLASLLLARGEASKHNCRKLSATKFIPTEDWERLKRYEQEFLRCYAVAAAARGAVLVGRSAARANGIWVIPHGQEVVELALREGNVPSKSQWPQDTIYRRMSVPDLDLLTTESLDAAGANKPWVATTPQRTVTDIARFHGVRDGVVALDSCLYKQSPINQLAFCEGLKETIARLSGKRGISAAREVVAMSSGKSESPYESLFRVILAEHGIEVAEQMWIGRYRVDFLWGQLIIEIDGYIKYEDVPHEVVLKQLARENWLREQGYEVIRIFPKEILRDEAACVQRVIELKARADARGPASVAPTR